MEYLVSVKGCTIKLKLKNKPVGVNVEKLLEGLCHTILAVDKTRQWLKFLELLLETANKLDNRVSS